MGAAAGDDSETVAAAEGHDGAGLPDRFERDEVCRLVGIDPDRLYDWAGARRSKGPAIVPPSRTPYSGSGRGRGPVFSWEDVATLRAVKRLHQAGAPTQLIRKAFVKLRQRGLTALQVGLLVEDKAIFMVDPDLEDGAASHREVLVSRTRTIVTPGQGVLIFASEESDKLRAEVRSLPGGRRQQDAAETAAAEQLELGSEPPQKRERRVG